VKIEEYVGWIPSEREKFEGSVYYHVLSIVASSQFPWKRIRRVESPLRVAFLVRTMALGRILTLNNLRKTSVIVVDLCYICKKSVESIDLSSSL